MNQLVQAVKLNSTELLQLIKCWTETIRVSRHVWLMSVRSETPEGHKAVKSLLPNTKKEI